MKEYTCKQCAHIFDRYGLIPYRQKRTTRVAYCPILGVYVDIDIGRGDCKHLTLIGQDPKEAEQ